MCPPLGYPPLELSTAEHAISKRIRRAKLFVCLRQHRHELCAEAFPQELMTLSTDQPQGHPPVPPCPTYSHRSDSRKCHADQTVDAHEAGSELLRSSRLQIFGHTREALHRADVVATLSIFSGNPQVIPQVHSRFVGQQGSIF